MSALTAAEGGLLAALRAGAEGCWPEEAAVGLLTTVAVAVWQHPDWQAACVQLDQVELDGVGLVVAEVDWSIAVAAAERVDVPRPRSRLYRSRPRSPRVRWGRPWAIWVSVIWIRS